MNQARIPQAILDRLPVGAATAELLAEIRNGVPSGLPPREGAALELARWVREHGFDADETIELLPAIVPPGELDAELAAWREKRRLFRFARALFVLAALATMTLGFRLGANPFGTPGVERESISMFVGIVLWFLGARLALTTFVHVAPLFVFVFSLAKLSPFSVVFAFLFLVHPLDPNSGPTLLLAAVAVMGGYAVTAHARGRSPWLGLLGILSLLWPDRNPVWPPPRSAGERRRD